MNGYLDLILIIISKKKTIALPIDCIYIFNCNYYEDVNI